jgi:hypothetical protein
VKVWGNVTDRVRHALPNSSHRVALCLDLLGRNGQQDAAQLPLYYIRLRHLQESPASERGTAGKKHRQGRRFQDQKRL